VTKHDRNVSREAGGSDAKLGCTWRGCGRDVGVGSLSTHGEDGHVVLWRELTRVARPWCWAPHGLRCAGPEGIKEDVESVVEGSVSTSMSPVGVEKEAVARSRGVWVGRRGALG